MSHDNIFKVTNLNFVYACTTSKFTGTVENGSTEMTVLPSYTGNLPRHRTPLNVPAISFVMNDCHYKLTGNTSSEDPSTKGLDTTVWIVCPVGEKSSWW